MDKVSLKQILRQQFEPLDEAVEKKLAYLQSDDVFTDETFTEEQELSMEEAFATFTKSAVSQSPSFLEKEQPSSLNNVQAVPKSVASIKFETPSEETINAHRQHIAERIAALRGMSLPGEYLNKKNF